MVGECKVCQSEAMTCFITVTFSIVLLKKKPNILHMQYQHSALQDYIEVSVMHFFCFTQSIIMLKKSCSGYAHC